jgi:TRAP-type uncharacterized transport system fused permease subunit
MIARTIIQTANLGFLIGIIFIAYFWFKAFQHRIKSNSALLDWMFYGVSIFSSKYFDEEGNQYRKKYWLATLVTIFMLLVPWAVRYFML